MLIGIEKVDRKNQAFYRSLFMSLAFKNTANLHACECVLSAEVANKSVTVHGTLFDYTELMRLSKVQSDGSRIIPGYPLEPFFMDQINPDRGTKNRIDSLIKNCEASPKPSHG